jgi:magnesium transporter
MQIIEFTADSLRFADGVPAAPPADGFTWIFLDRDDFATHRATLQDAAHLLGGSALLDLHCQDLSNANHPSHYDYTSVYDLVIFRRLATQVETRTETEQEAAVEAYHGQGGKPRIRPKGGLPAFNRIRSRAVGFIVFDRLLISVHPRGCYAARSLSSGFWPTPSRASTRPLHAAASRAVRQIWSCAWSMPWWTATSTCARN